MYGLKPVPFKECFSKSPSVLLYRRRFGRGKTHLGRFDEGHGGFHSSLAAALRPLILPQGDLAICDFGIRDPAIETGQGNGESSGRGSSGSHRTMAPLEVQRAFGRSGEVSSCI